ncbi:MAG: sialate O-acetylesterase, partial [Dysgonamonadaceae bacterium]|nr:sialate O-acetylesterase [Dysgonamonadaceae bacterium]
MRKRMKLLFLAFFVAIASLQTIYAEVKLPAVFGDNMVLQQQSNVAVWGWAKPNASVSVKSSWNGKSYTAKADANGSWKIKISTPAAGFTAYTLTVSEGKTIVLKNVLIGEVWLCSGQSNMEMPMKGFGGQPIAGGPDAIATSRNENIRLFTVKRVSEIQPQTDCTGSWSEATAGTVANFSATAYYFGRLLFRNLNVPIGLLHTSWGGSAIEAWMTPEAFKDIPEKKLPQKKEDIKSANGTPTVLYNGMLYPLVGYGIRGAIWYQGEANRNEPNLYVKMFDKMVREWRRIWEVGEFPFYYCQIAPYDYGTGGISSAFIREAQAKGMKTTPNTGMAVLMDAESPDCIHPPKKKDAGERMALWALAETYGVKDLPYKSPEIGKVEITGRMVTIT